MATIAFEAWLDRTTPIEVATPVYQSTTTTINFTVLTAARAAKSLVGKTVKFAGRTVDDGVTLFDRVCTVTSAAGGLCSAALTAANLANAGEYIGQLSVLEPGSPDTAEERVQFRFRVVEVL